MSKRVARKVKTTLFLSKEDRETVRRSGKTVEQFFGELMKRYRILTMDRWTEGSVYHDYIRVCCIRAETLNFLLDNLKFEDLRSVGREVGKRALKAFKYAYDWDLTDPKNRERLIQTINARVGWGKVGLGDNKVVVERPVCTKPDFLMGYLEGTLRSKLELVEAYRDRFVFLIKDKGTVETPPHH